MAIIEKEENRKIKTEYRNAIRSKTMIKDALLSLMIEKPFDKISITDIVKKADINRGTFYAHYSNTADVLKSISYSVVEDLAATFSTYNSFNAINNPEVFLTAITSYLIKNPVYYIKLLKVDKIYDVLNEARYTSIRKIMSKMPVEIKRDDEKNKIEVALDFAITGMIGIYSDILLEKVPIKLENSVEYLSLVLKPQRDLINQIIANNKIPQDRDN